MARHKDVDWELAEGRGQLRLVNNDQVQIAVLMDIRDELKCLNQLLHCSRFVGIPRTLDEIRKQTKRKRLPLPEHLRTKVKK